LKFRESGRDSGGVHGHIFDIAKHVYANHEAASILGKAGIFCS
jgi:hypothetical protein